MKVLLLTIDAWRASHASFDPGAATPRTPNLAETAEEGVAFTEAVSQGPATPYAFPAIMTSTYPLDHGGYESLSPDRTLASEALSGAGWRCVGVHSNPWLGEKYGYGRGYDDYRDVGEFGLPFLERGRELLLDRFGLDHPVYRAAQTAYRKLQGPLRSVGGGTADEVRVARSALSGADGDTFVWAHLLAPHAPYAPPKRHREAEGVADVDATDLVTRAQRAPGELSPADREAVCGLYAASVRHADAQAGRIVEAADEDTLIVVTADHGEALFDHGAVGHPPDVYDELVRVPLLVRPPGGAPSPGTIDAQVRHVDIAPTILDYAGVDPPSSYEGRSLRTAIEGASPAGDAVPPRPAVSEVASTESRPGRVDPDALRIGVRTPERKLRYDDGDVHGFDLRDDPDEERPIPEPSGEAWSRLRGLLRDRRESIAFEGRAVERDAATEDRLRDLGYLE